MPFLGGVVPLWLFAERTRFKSGRGWRRAALMLCALLLPLHALGSDGRSRIHATIGQPLSIQLPLQLSGSRAGSVDVGVEAVSGVPDAERDVAESVVASYDRSNSQLHLTTPGRVTVPLIRLRLTIVGEALSIVQDVDVLVDLPDFRRQFDRPGAAEPAAGSASAAVNGIKVFEAGGQRPEARLFGDSAAADRMEGASGRPVATPAWVPPGRSDSPPPQPGHAPQKPSRGRVLVAGPRPGREAAPRPEKEQSGSTVLASVWLEALKARLARTGISAEGLSPPGSREADDRTREMLAAAAGAPLAAALLTLLFYRLPRLRHALQRRAVDRADRQPASGPPRGEAGELARLRRMLDDNPWRSDLRYQFVQRLHKARDAASFAEAALPLKPVASEEIWRRVQAMADELLPGDARFA